MGFLLWFTWGKGRGGIDSFVCLAFKNSLLGGGEGGCFDGCCCCSLSGIPERLGRWGQDASQ